MLDYLISDSGPDDRRPLPSRSRRPARREPARPRGRLGSLPWYHGVLLVFGGAALGAVATIAAGSEPGVLLGCFLVAGTVIATLTVQRRAVYVLIPMPALAYLAAAIMAGLVHDRAITTTLTALLIGATQWVAGGFIAVVGATAVACVATAARWPRRSRRR